MTRSVLFLSALLAFTACKKDEAAAPAAGSAAAAPAMAAAGSAAAAPTMAAAGSAAAVPAAAPGGPDCAAMGGVMDALLVAMDKDASDPKLAAMHKAIGPQLHDAVIARCKVESWAPADMTCVIEASKPGNESKDCTGPGADKIGASILAVMQDGISKYTATTGSGEKP